MKLGDIVRNWSASKSNPARCLIVLRADSRNVYCVNRDGGLVWFSRKYANFEVLGSIDLSPFDRELEEHASLDCGAMRKDGAQ